MHLKSMRMLLRRPQSSGCCRQCPAAGCRPVLLRLRQNQSELVVTSAKLLAFKEKESPCLIQWLQAFKTSRFLHCDGEWLGLTDITGHRGLIEPKHR